MVVRLPIVTTSTTQEAGLPLPLVVRTIPLDLASDASLLDFLPTNQPVTWLRRGDGLVGWGRAAEIQTSGPTRFADAAKWWSEATSHAVVRDEVDLPGTGLVCFGSFAFADEPGSSILVVPEVIVGRRGDRTWLTTVSRGALDTAATVTVAEAPAPPPPPIAVPSHHRSSPGPPVGYQPAATFGVCSLMPPSY